jgi:hypothetical protein
MFGTFFRRTMPIPIGRLNPATQPVLVIVS